MRSYLTILLLLFKITFVFCQNYSLNDFKESSIPDIYSSDWHELNSATDKEFIFSVCSGKIKIEKFYDNSDFQYQFANGTLIAINMGEFGGGLYYKPLDTSSFKKLFVNGKDVKSIRQTFFGGLLAPPKNPINEVIKNAYLLQSGTFKFIFLLNDKLYLMSGLSHMDITFGDLFTIRAIKDSFFISHALHIDDSPEAMTVYKSKIFIATAKGFYILDKNLNKEKIFENLFWYGLYPTSVVVLDEENIYVTIRGGYAKLNAIKKEIKFFKAK